MKKLLIPILFIVNMAPASGQYFGMDANIVATDTAYAYHLFDIETEEVLPTAYSFLDSIADRLLADQKVYLYIYCNISDSGMKMSYTRAGDLVWYLEQKGIDPERIGRVGGHCYRSDLYSDESIKNLTSEKEQAAAIRQNKRTEFVFFYKKT